MINTIVNGIDTMVYNNHNTEVKMRGKEYLFVA